MPAAPRPSAAPLWLLVALALLAVALTGWRLFTVDEGSFVTSISNDDTYYYLQVARNVARGIGPSFDGLEWTNGFQPIWGAALVPIYSLVGDPLVAARAACFLGLLLHVAAMLVLYGLLSSVFGSWPTALATAASIANLAFRDVAILGMDYGLNGLLEVICVAVCLRAFRREGSIGTRVLPGMLLGFAFIQRPDNALLAAAVCLPLLARARSVREVAPVFGGWCALALPWLLLSWGVFGSPLPISGTIKTSYTLAEWDAGHGAQGALETLARLPVHHLPEPTLTLLGGSLTRAVLAPDSLRIALSVGLLVCGALAVLRASAPRSILFFALAHALLLAALMHPHVHQGRWYFAPEDLAGVLFTAATLHTLSRLAPGVLPFAGALGFTLILGALVHGESAQRALPEPASDQEEVVALEVSRWIREEIPRGTLIGTFNAGRIGYYVDDHIVNLDGLVNTYAYASAVLFEPKTAQDVRMALLRYFLARGLRWHVDVWGEEYAGRWPEATFGPDVATFFTMEMSWPVREKHDGTRPASYQAYRFDLERARKTWLATGGELLW